MSGAAWNLARLCNGIFSRTLTGQQDELFYRDVDEAISLARALAQEEESPSGAAQLWEIKRRMTRIKNRRNG